MSLLTDSVLLDLLGVITAFIAVIYAYYKWSYQYWKKKNVPYLEPAIPWGSMENPRKRTIGVGEWIRKTYQGIKGKGYKYCGSYSFTSPSLWIIDLDLVKQIMTKDFYNFVDRGFYVNEKDDPLSCHLFNIGGAKWRNLRTKLSPTFTSGKMKGMFSTLVECGMVLEKYIENSVDNNEPVDIKDVLGNFSTDIIGSCAFGLECNSFKDANSPFRVYGKKIFTGSSFGNLKTAFCMNFPQLAALLRLKTTPQDVSDFFMKVVEDTVAYREKNNYSRNDFLQLLIDVKNNKDAQGVEHRGDGKTLTMDDLAAQCFVFFLAGFETSSTTMTFALYELATNQNYQDKVREEINTVLAKHDRKVTYDSLSELKYMRQVIDETLRKYPPVPLVTRVSGDDYKLPGEDVVLEKGTRVLIPIEGIHYDEEYYEKPHVFDPERFTEENKASRHPYAHIPFGEGPRICIGERFGIMQTKVGLTTILRNFKVTLNRKTKVPLKYSTSSFIPSVEGGIWLDIKKI